MLGWAHVLVDLSESAFRFILFLAALHFLRPRAALKERKAMEKAFQERHGGSCGEVLNCVSVPGIVYDTSFLDLCPADECVLARASNAH